MSDETIFGGAATPAPSEAPKPQIAVPDSVQELIGEGKKYATVELALAALPHAQSHIATLQSENKALKEKTEQGRSAEEVYNTVQELLKAEKATPALATLDESSIAAILDRKLTERELNQRAAANVATVKDALVGKFGDKAEEVYKAKAAEMGVSVSFLNDIVKASPAAANELFGLKPQPRAAPSPTMGGIRTEALQSTSNPPKQAIMGGATTGQIMDAWRRAAAPKN